MTKTAPLNDLIFQNIETVFSRLANTPYAGAPSPTIDTAWDKLLEPMHMRVTEGELRRDNQASVSLPEGGGFLGWMGVFHELHCIVCILSLYTTLLRKADGRLEDASRVDISRLLPS